LCDDDDDAAGFHLFQKLESVVEGAEVSLPIALDAAINLVGAIVFTFGDPKEVQAQVIEVLTENLEKNLALRAKTRN
jgi:hypothetical protein